MDSMAPLLPLMAMLSAVRLNEEFKMEGKLDSELNRLLEERLKLTGQMLFKSEIEYLVETSYPVATSLWTIIKDSLYTYHLLPEVSTNTDGVIVITLTEEASEWKH